MFRKIKLKALHLILLLMLCFVWHEGWARRRSRSFFGRRSHYRDEDLTFEDTMWRIIFFLVIVACIIGCKLLYDAKYANKRRKLALEQSDAALQLMKQSESEDPAWNRDHFIDLVKEAFNKVQQDRTERNPDRVGEIKLDEIRIIGMEDWLDNSRDSFSAFLTGSMEYYYGKESNNVSTQRKMTTTPFTEIWRFIRQDNTWVLDAIDKNVTHDEVFFFPIRKQQPLNSNS